MKTFLEEIPKPMIHEAFYLYSDESDYREYEMIDKEAMHALLLRRFKHDLNLIQFVDACDRLIKHAKTAQEKGSFTLKSLAYETYLKEGLFLVESVRKIDGVYHFKFPKQIQNSLLNLEKNPQVKEIKLFKTLVDGLLEVYGVLTFDEIDAIDKRTRAHRRISFNVLDDIPFLKEHLLLKGVRIYEDGITHPLIDLLNLDVDVYLPKKLYDLEFYVAFSHQAYDDHIYDYYENKAYRQYRQEKMKDNLSQHVQNTRLDVLENSVDPRLFVWPIWTLGGRTIENNELDIIFHYN